MNFIIKIIKKVYALFMQKLSPISYARKLGVTIGEGCVLESFNFGSEPWLITLGNHVEVTQNVQFITHDGATWVIRREERYRDVIRFGKIVLKDNVFIGYGSIILPNVTIGENSVIAAGSVVTKDIPANSIAAGNPARVISNWETYAEKCLRETPIYSKEAYTKNKRAEVLRFLNETEEA